MRICIEGAVFFHCWRRQNPRWYHVNQRRNFATTGGPPSHYVQSLAPTLQYIADQVTAFRDWYGLLPDYKYTEAYLKDELSLATNGDESRRVKEVLEPGLMILQRPVRKQQVWRKSRQNGARILLALCCVQKNRP
jgi:hypothetical protein